MAVLGGLGVFGMTAWLLLKGGLLWGRTFSF